MSFSIKIHISFSHNLHTNKFVDCIVMHNPKTHVFFRVKIINTSIIIRLKTYYKQINYYKLKKKEYFFKPRYNVLYLSNFLLVF